MCMTWSQDRPRRPVNAEAYEGMMVNWNSYLEDMTVA